MRLRFISALVSLLLTTQAWARLTTDNMRLDHAIYPEHPPKLIIAGTIDAIHTDARWMEPEVTFRFLIQDVILGDKKYKGHELTIGASNLNWPNDLVPFKEATRCILVLGKWPGERSDRHYITAVVPASGKRLPMAKDGEEAKRILEGEILAELQSEKLPERQRALLQQLAPILTKKHASEVVPFTKSENVWVMRAALSALVYATEEEQYIKKMATDVREFFTNSPDTLKNRWSLHPYHFLDYYFFLEQRSWTWGSMWNEAEAAKHLRILNAIFGTGIISDEVKKKLNPEPANAPGKK